MIEAFFRGETGIQRPDEQNAGHKQQNSSDTMRNRGIRCYRKFDGTDIEIDRTVVLAATWFHLIAPRAIEWSEFEA